MENCENTMIVKQAGGKSPRRTPKMIRITCCGTQKRKIAKLIHPRNRQEVFAAVEALRDDPCAQCLLVGTAFGENCMSVKDLTEFLREAEEKSEKTVSLYMPNSAFACGEEPRCQWRNFEVEVEALTLFLQTLKNTQSVEVAIGYVYYTLSFRDRSILARWATRADPQNPLIPIRASILAKEFSLSERHVRRIIASANRIHPEVFKFLERLRKDQGRITRLKHDASH